LISKTDEIKENILEYENYLNEALTSTAKKNTDELESLRSQAIQYCWYKEHTLGTLVDLRQSRE
jgi:hypothetical protein